MRDCIRWFKCKLKPPNHKTGESGEAALQEQPLPGTSRDPPSSGRDMRSHFVTSEEKMQDVIRQAEVSKARIFNTPGKPQQLQQLNSNFLSPTAVVDEGYFIVGAHLDEATVNKIGKGEYIDFGKLLPKDKVMSEEDRKLKMIIKNGKTFWTPASNSVSINSFAKWEQAFRVYSNVYCKANPNCAAELIEYNNVIHTIAMAYTWDNMYTYDREFRIHMSRFPQRSWAMILQQAWSLRLRDRITVGNNWWTIGNASGSNGNGGGKRSQINEPCRRFNRGRCNFGSNCKYKHRCSYCFKFGHGSVNCRKAQGDRQNFRSKKQDEGEKRIFILGIITKTGFLRKNKEKTDFQDLYHSI